MRAKAEFKSLLREFLTGFSQLPQLVRRIAFKPRTLEEELQEVSAPPPAQLGVQCEHQRASQGVG